jgi:hypothetical protein
MLRAISILGSSICGGAVAKSILNKVAQWSRLCPKSLQFLQIVKCSTSHNPTGPRCLLQVLNKQTPWPESENELYLPSDRRLLTKLVPTFANRWCHVISVTDTICNRSHKNICEESQKSDGTKQQPTNKRPVQSTRNRKKTQQNVARGSR